MIIEILYQDVCNLFGDPANIRYLEKCLPKAKFIYTKINETPYFVDNEVNMVYMGPGAEKYQEIIIEKLMPYKERIEQLIEDSTLFLILNNSFGIFCNNITEDNKSIKALGIFNFEIKRDMMKRYHELYLGTFKSSNIVGFKSQFDQIYGDIKDNNLFTTIEGFGMNKQEMKEGFIYKNFISTYVLGPILLSNPDFTKFILKQLGVKNSKLAFEKAINDAYKQRLKQLTS